jgi:prepilin-type N-terminal cleavage/methylation domain-containing protein
MRQHESGYSLAEMLTVVAIIGVLSLVFIPNFMEFRDTNKMKTSMRNLTSDLRTTRQLAITQGKQAAVVFNTGSGQRSYNIYLGDKSYGSTVWSPLTGTGSNPPKSTKYLDDIAYFPANSITTPQTFTMDMVNCSDASFLPKCRSGQGLTGNPADGTDTLTDVVFFPDGRVAFPTVSPPPTSLSITIKTDINKISRPQYQVFVTPTGRVIACSCALTAQGQCPSNCM